MLSTRAQIEQTRCLPEPRRTQNANDRQSAACPEEAAWPTAKFPTVLHIQDKPVHGAYAIETMFHQSRTSATINGRGRTSFTQSVPLTSLEFKCVNRSVLLGRPSETAATSLTDSIGICLSKRIVLHT